MTDLKTVVDFLDAELRTDEIPDYPGAHNGLQLQNDRGRVNRVASAVDGSLPVIRKAIAMEADLLIVHHGLFWQGVRRLTGPWYEKLRLAMEAGLAIYSSHLPLDIHPDFGNNVLLTRALGMEDGEPFLDWKEIQLGRKSFFNGSLGELTRLVESAVGGRVLRRGEANEPAGQVGVITGGAGSEVEAVAREGIETLITGEGPHWSHPLAEELGLQVIYAGHYATETFGVRALVEHLHQQFGLDGVAIDHPTGL